MTTPAPSQTDARRFETVTLANPITRGEQTFDTITLRKPRAGELRGLSLQDLISTDIVALLTIIPRISNPSLASHEVDELEAEDLSLIGGTVRGFFMTPQERDLIEQMIANQRPKT